MVDTLSLLTITSISFITSVLFVNTNGLLIAFSLHVFVTALFFYLEVASFIIPAIELLIFYYVATFAWMLVGCCIGRIENLPKLLNSMFISASTVNPEVANITMTKTIIWVILYGFSFVPYELNLGSNWPEPAGGFTTLLANIIMWIIFYYLYKNEHYLFNVKGDEQDTAKIVQTVTSKLAFIQTLYILIFILFDWLGEFFITNMWYFWISLIMAGISWILIWIFKAVDDEKKQKK